jgi:tRNA nucleotidyltransferase/poly(A) polymerase
MDNVYLWQALKILSGSTTYLVGGCVRDKILGRTPKDFDIVTDMPITKVIEEFTYSGWKCDEVGKQFLVTIVSKDGQMFEISNFRSESAKSSDGRHPDSVEVGDIHTDSQRRDFTVNSIYYDYDNDSYIDLQNGRKDIDRKLLRFIGRPADRIKEDYLRVFRFYRFLHQLKFQPDEESLKACRQHFRDAKEKTSAERIRMEMERMAGI